MFFLRKQSLLDKTVDLCYNTKKFKALKGFK